MRRSRVGTGAVVALLLVALYLRDPPWAGQVTSGLVDWATDRSGTRFRWTNGRATFFVPSDATSMTLPLRSYFPGPNGGPVIVSVAVDDRWLADIELRRPEEWVRPVLPLPRKATSRSFRRVDLRVSRTVVTWAILGVMSGEIELQGAH
jgi:hypothetical protein